RPTTSVMGKIICRLGFSSRASWRNCCTARCWSIWYRFFIATLSFFLAEKLPAIIMTAVESRYFLRTNGHPPAPGANGIVTIARTRLFNLELHRKAQHLLSAFYRTRSPGQNPNVGITANNRAKFPRQGSALILVQ